VTRRSLLRAALARPRPVLGTWIKLPATEVVELVALAGFDLVVIDLEHSPIDLETAHRLIGTALNVGVSPVVRVADLHPGLVQRLLDAGAEGVMVPHVDTPDQARAAAAAARFPPLGTRGVGATSRAGQWGALPLAQYLRFGQEEVVLIAQVESAEGVANTAAIAAVPGVDALLVGAADLAVSQGTTPADPAVRTQIASVVAQGRAAGLPVGTAGGATADAVRAALDDGFDLVLLSNDATLLGTAARAAVETATTVVAGHAPAPERTP
jgi:2-keto-3-deoxy-L-rhamnonate aldolase RhmA